SDGKWVVPNVRPSETTTAVAASPVTDGDVLTFSDYEGDPDLKTGLYALLKTDLFNLLCIPPPVRGEDTAASVYSKAIRLCVDKRAMLLVDSPISWGSNVDKAVSNPIQNFCVF